MRKKTSAAVAKWLWSPAPMAADPTRRMNGVMRRRSQRRTEQQHRYDELVEQMKREYDIRINRWRTSSSGCAWRVEYRNGTVTRLIEAPYPRGPISAAVFLHEVGHHAIGFYRYKPRCYEEYKAWQWSLKTMRAHGLNVTPRVEQLVDQCLRYAVAKARRRGLRRLPVELMKYL